jgi:broad specificity phosphatase PhoE
LGPVLASYQPALVVLSPLRRAWQTYLAASVPGVRVVFDSRVIEAGWGRPDFYGDIKPLATPAFGEPDQHDAWDIPAPERAATFLNEMLAQGLERIIVVGHWGIFSALFRAFCMDGQTTSVPVAASMHNCAVSRLGIDARGTRVLYAWNERAHVADLHDN